MDFEVALLDVLELLGRGIAGEVALEFLDFFLLLGWRDFVLLQAIIEFNLDEIALIFELVIS